MTPGDPDITMLHSEIFDSKPDCSLFSIICLKFKAVSEDKYWKTQNSFHQAGDLLVPSRVRGVRDQSMFSWFHVFAEVSTDSMFSARYGSSRLELVFSEDIISGRAINTAHLSTYVSDVLALSKILSSSLVVASSYRLVRFFLGKFYWLFFSLYPLSITFDALIPRRPDLFASGFATLVSTPQNVPKILGKTTYILDYRWRLVDADFGAS
ncbi:hypothetical protein HETIRDRAFT_118095 [Heterobasidion irregulare TC 32-1]|uniref:Uncharacterized protein n=1 Tax=Heterobasidion irregulare (strain TC 32-1) TaxID=747525 RepID=W4K769_HETIT|nr:uncharacterized protein HETIRDRAFT_118095 [Heterobasidion irregulare TC 32-1]ETW81648.1 hypothetical protein HETIRDRAFT_118095 [Heterobasidion irregulare TC 32-1]